MTTADPILCYCNSLTVGALQAAFRRCGNLAAVQKETRAGMVCGGCRLVLESVFGEAPDEILSISGEAGLKAGALMRPGTRVMKGFVVADHRLDSVVSSCNGVPPQFQGQTMDVPIEYALLDQDGKVVLHRKATLATHETFRFDTSKEDIPRPLYGMFLLSIGRANYGAARFNVAWTNGVSSASTHEINDSGRPNVYLPVVGDVEFLAGPNRVHLAVQNPRGRVANLLLKLQTPEGMPIARTPLPLPPHSTRWIDVNRELFAPAVERHPGGAVLKVESEGLRPDMAPTVYFFFHNLNSDIWSANHL